MSKKKVNYGIDIGSDVDLDIDLQTKQATEQDREILPQTRMLIYQNGYIDLMKVRLYKQPLEKSIMNYKLIKEPRATFINFFTSTGIKYLSISDQGDNTILHSIECEKDMKGDTKAKIKLLNSLDIPIFTNSKIEVVKFDNYFWTGVIEKIPIKQKKLYELDSVGLYHKIKNLKITPIKYNIKRIEKDSRGYKISYNIAEKKYNQLEFKRGYYAILRNLKETKDEGIRKITFDGKIENGFVYINYSLDKSLGNYTDGSIEFIPDIFNCVGTEKPLLMDIFIRFCELCLNEDGLDFIKLNRSRLLNKDYFYFKYQKDFKKILNSLTLHKPFALGEMEVGGFVDMIESLSGNLLKIYVSGVNEWSMTETIKHNQTFIENADLLDVSIEEDSSKIFNEISIRAKVYEKDLSKITNKTIVKRDVPSINIYGKNTYREALDDPNHIDTVELYANNFLQVYKNPNYTIKSKKMRVVENLNPALYRIISTQFNQNRKVKITKIEETNGSGKTIYYNNIENKESYYQVVDEYRVTIDNLNYEIDFILSQENDIKFFSSKYYSLNFFMKNDFHRGSIFKVIVYGKTTQKEYFIESKDIGIYELININLSNFEDFEIQKIKIKPLKNNFKASFSNFSINGVFSSVYNIELGNLSYSYKDGSENYQLSFSNISNFAKRNIDRLKAKINFKNEI